MIQEIPGAETIWDLHDWPWEHDGVRVLPVLHGRLEFARAVRAQLDAFDPGAVVIEIPKPLAEPWKRAVGKLPVIQVVRADLGPDERRWLMVEPTDAAVEATRWALAREVPLHCGDLLVPAYRAHRDPVPDPAVIPEIGYAPFVRAALSVPQRARQDDVDGKREQALAATALAARSSTARVVLVCGLMHLRGVFSALRDGAATPLFRMPSVESAVLPLAPDGLVEVLSEVPFVQAAWERARAGELPCPFCSPDPPKRPATVLSFPGTRAASSEPTVEEWELFFEERALGRDDDLLARPRLLYRLVDHTVQYQRTVGGGVPSLVERRTMHHYARNLALFETRLCPDLYELSIAARGCVDDRFARSLLRVAGYWPWQGTPAGAVRLNAEDLQLGARLIRLRPKLDRLAKRPQLTRLLARLDEQLGAFSSICSHEPEDLVVETLGAELRERGRRRVTRAGERLIPFSASLLDGLDARETLRRSIVDGRPWVREEVLGRSEAGAVVLIFDEDRDASEERFPYLQVWHGEHDNESDLAFYSTAPDDTPLAPGIHRAEYGGFLMIWPPRQLGDIWFDPAYAFTRGKAERLVVAGLDYSRQPLVVVVSAKAPRAELRMLAGRLGKRLVHLPLGSLASDRLRRIRSFHILAGRHLRPIAARLIDPT